MTSYFPMTCTQLASALTSDPRRFGQSHQWIWRGWSIHYTYQASLATTDSTPTLLLHGFGASVGHWRHNILPLGSTRPVYALDLLGFGGSEKPQVDYTVDLWIEQVHDFWQTHLQQPTILVGHSVGALVALLVAARYPEMVKGLCLISCADGPHPEDLPHPWDWLVQGISETAMGILGFPLTYPLLFRWLRRTETLRSWVKNLYKRDEQVDDDLIEIFQRPAFDVGADYVFLDSLRAVVTRRFGNPKHVLPQIQVPILLIWGKEDPAVPSFLADQFQRWNPQIMLVKLPGIGHCAHDELPLWVNTLISEWAASLEVVRDLPL
jgi:haloalkane dehalogenase